MRQLNFTRVRQALKNIENESSYYCGGTLFIDFQDMPCVGLNLDGRGFSYAPSFGKLPSKRFLMTREMQDLVRLIYLKVKGKTPYFDSKVR